jgi:autotransporter-associated beta strand protein
MSDPSHSRLTRKILTAAATCAAISALAGTARAQIVYEPFDLAAGSLGGNTNGLSGVKWVYGATTTADTQVLSENFAPPAGLAQPIVGNDLAVRGKDDSNANLTSVERLALSDYSSGDLYLSVRINVKNINSTVSNGTGAFFTGFAPSPGGNTTSVNFAGARLRIQKSPTNSGSFEVGIQNDVNNGAGTFAIGSSPTVFVNNDQPLNTPILVVARYHFNPVTFSDDVASVWVSPAASTYGAPESPAADATSTGCDTIANGDPVPTIRSAFFRQNPSGADNMTVDDFRIGRTWASVTPAAGTTWSSTSDGNWGGANWSAGVPDAANSFAYFDDTSSVHTVSLGGTRTVGSMFVTTATGYNFAGGTIIFDGGMGTTVHGSSGLTVNAVKDPSFATILNANNTIGSNVTLNNDLYVSIGAGQTLTMSGNINQSTQSALTKFGGGTLLLTGSNSYTGGTGVYDGTLVVSASNQLGAGGTLTIDGGTMRTDAALALTGNVTIAGTGTFNSNGFNTAINGLMTGAGTLSKQGNGVLTVNGARIAGFNIAGGALAVSLGRDTAGKTSVITGMLSIATASGAMLDLGNNDLVWNYTGASPGSADPAKLTAVQGLLASGYAAGAWNGPGINSSAAKLNPKTALGYAEASSIPGFGTIDGISTDGDMIVVRYTYAGDADLSGGVNTSDFTTMAQNFGKTGQVWVQGDFNYDGVVNALDFNAIATNFGAPAIASPPALGSVVPEPGSFALIGAALVSVARVRSPRKRLRSKQTPKA